MAEIPSYDDWMRSTSVMMSVRSSQLKAVDSALRDYWNSPSGGARQPKRNALGAALANWIGTKGPEWRNSDRNRPPARMVERLYDALNTTMFNQADLEAFEFQDAERRKRIETLFRNKEIVWKVLNPAKEVKEAHREMQGLSSSGRSKPSPASATDIAAIRKQQRTEASRRVVYEPGRGKFGREVADVSFQTGLGVSSIVTNNLNWPAEQRFGLGGTAMAGGDFHQMMHDLAGGGASSSEINWHLFQTIGMSTHQLAADVVPIVSNVLSGAKVLIAWGKAARSVYQRYKVSCQTDYIMPGGDVASAFKSLQTLLDRKVSADTRDAGLQTADFATRTVLSFVDLGAASSTAAGVAFALAKFLHKLALLLREFAETRDARQLLSNPANLDTRLFSTYPLLGCYMLLCSDTSEVINMVRTEQMRKGAIRFGDLAWRQQVEWIKRGNLDPVLVRAADVVYSSPFFIRDSVTKQGMPFHALHQVGILSRTAQKLGKASLGVDVLRLGNRLV